MRYESSSKIIGHADHAEQQKRAETQKIYIENVQ